MPYGSLLRLNIDDQQVTVPTTPPHPWLSVICDEFMLKQHLVMMNKYDYYLLMPNDC